MVSELGLSRKGPIASQTAMSVFVGIDIGSSTIKGAIIDATRGSISDFCSRPFPEPLGGLPPSHFEVKSENIIAATEEVVAALLKQCSECRGIYFCSQMGGLVLARPDGTSLTNYISWRDQRTRAPHPSGAGSFVDELRRRTSKSDLGLIGNELQAGSASSILFWMVETETLPSGVVLAMNLGDYVVAQLCGTEPTTEFTLALGNVDLEKGVIHQEWFDQIGCKNVSWPPLVDVGQRVGSYRRDSRDIPCYPAVGDHQAALLGAGLKPRELSINASTGSQVSMLTEVLQCCDAYQTRPFFGRQYLNTITHLPAGRSLNAIVDLLAELATRDGHAISKPWDHIATAIEETGDSNLDVDLSFFESKLGSEGHIRRMRLENLTVGHVFRAALNNMADNFLQCALNVSPYRDWSCLVLSGGLAQKLPYLQVAIENRFDAPVRVSHVDEETLTGLMKLAAD